MTALASPIQVSGGFDEEQAARLARIVSALLDDLGLVGIERPGAPPTTG